jgi:hypothetical protein
VAAVADPLDEPRYPDEARHERAPPSTYLPSSERTQRGLACRLVAVRRGCPARYAAGGGGGGLGGGGLGGLGGNMGDAESEVSSRCAHVRPSTATRLGPHSKKSPDFLRGRGLRLTEWDT